MRPWWKCHKSCKRRSSEKCPCQGIPRQDYHQECAGYLLDMLFDFFLDNPLTQLYAVCAPPLDTFYQETVVFRVDDANNPRLGWRSSSLKSQSISQTLNVMYGIFTVPTLTFQTTPMYVICPMYINTNTDTSYMECLAIPVGLDLERISGGFCFSPKTCASHRPRVTTTRVRVRRAWWLG